MCKTNALFVDFHPSLNLMQKILVTVILVQYRIKKEI
jgi:hypothetical protein